MNSYDFNTMPHEGFMMSQDYVDGILQPAPSHQFNIGVQHTDDFTVGANAAHHLAASPVPEPATIMIMMAGIGSLALRKLRKPRV